MLCIYFISLTACTYLVIIAFCPPTSHHISGDDEHDNEEHQEDHQDIMPRVTATAPAASAAAAAAKKPTAGAKTSGETKADYPPSSVRTVSRIYGLGRRTSTPSPRCPRGTLISTSSALSSTACYPKRGGINPLEGRLHTLVEPSRRLPPLQFQASTAHHGPRLLRVSRPSAGV